jgi:polar amino acid transport system permease protein
MSAAYHVFRDNWQFLAGGFWVTLALSATAIAVGLVVGSGVGIARAYGGPAVSGLLSVYVDLMRAIPQLVILIWVFFSLPSLTQFALSPFAAGAMGLGLHMGAYVSEIVRGGLLSVRSGQLRAALAVGMSRAQAIRRIILPQAVIRMIPPLSSQVVVTIKDSAIASVIAAPEMLFRGQIVVTRTFRPFEIYTGLMIVYFLITFPVARGIDRVYQRLARLGAS